MKKKTKKNKRKVFIASRRGVLMVAVIAALVLLINIITASYSWFTPQQDAKSGMQYIFQGKARSESCTFSTFKGTKVTTADIPNGQYVNMINYGSSAVTGSQTIAANSIGYFKTEIINSDTNNASDISLYIKSMPACTLAVTFPGNSVRTFSSAQTDCYIVRDAYVKKNVATDVNGPGKLVIEWFIKTGSSSVTINLNNLYLLYN